MRIAAALVTSLIALLAAASPVAAQECMTADPPPVTKPAHTLRFGITPGAAGSAGASQGQVAPIDETRSSAALRDVRPASKAFVMRLNRLFWADGDEGIGRFAAMVDRYQAEGFQVESQVRYHPPEGREGDIPAWEQYVRKAVRELGSRPAVSAFSITNEANLPVSPNTSDGAYEGVVEALVRGVIVARDELDRIGREDIEIGFTLMWRWTPESDAKFWEDIAARATPEFRVALDYVGLQIYPGLVWPPSPRPGVSAGDEVIEALTLLRRCYMPKAALGDDVDVWVSENGYATNLGRSEKQQADSLDSTVRSLHRWSGELGISDYRWFNLRDNNSDGTDLFAAVGLLRDDYSPKPSYPLYRALVDQLGNRAPPRPEPRMSARARRRSLTGRIVRPQGAPRAACTGTVTVRWRRGRQRTSVGDDCTFRHRVPARGRVAARYNGNYWMRPAVRIARKR